MSSERSVLVIAGLGTWVDDTPKVGKIETHVHPIGRAADHVAFVCTGPRTDRTDDITFHQVRPSRWRPLTLLRQFALALWLSLTQDYDLIASFSLLPYGIGALVCGKLSRTPVHLGIIGGDLDVHATSRYGWVVRWLFRRFDVVSVAGSVHRQELIEYGVDPARIYIVLHPVSESFAEVSPAADPEYDLLWLTRMAPEKDPLLFVAIAGELRDRGCEFSAAMVGDGPEASTVEAAIRDRELTEHIDLPGWASDPAGYYRTARLYVLTSEREMLPLTLVEAMSVGVPPVSPPVGAIPDVIDDGRNGIVVGERSPEAFADAIQPLLEDDRRRTEMARRGSEIRSRTSEAAVARTWDQLLDDLVSDGASTLTEREQTTPPRP